MLDEALHYLQPLPGLRYIDCTLGDGGHTLEILRKGGEVLGIDAFPDALERARQRMKDEAIEKLKKRINELESELDLAGVCIRGLRGY